MKLSYLLFTVLLLATSVSIKAEHQYKIDGTISVKHNGSYVYITELSPDNPMDAVPVFADSAAIADGKFSFEGVVRDDISLFVISLGKASGSFITLSAAELKADYVETDEVGYFRVSGSALNEQLTQFVEQPMELYKKVGEMMKERVELMAKNEWTEAKAAEADSFFKDRSLSYMSLASQIIKENFDNPVGEYLLILLAGNINKEVMDEIEPKLRVSVKKSIEANKILLAEKMKLHQENGSDNNLVKVGEEYVDFSGETLSGDRTSLSSNIKSKKLILLDFWASWCLPCLKEIPEIVELYAEYKDKGFEIVSISLDKDRAPWKRMIEKKEMTWVQIIDSDLSNPIRTIYGVVTIPHTVLIDENGIVVANGLRGDDLKKRVESILK